MGLIKESDQELSLSIRKKRQNHNLCYHSNSNTRAMMDKHCFCCSAAACFVALKDEGGVWVVENSTPAGKGRKNKSDAHTDTHTRSLNNRHGEGDVYVLRS